MREVVVVSYARTGLAKSARGGFNITHGAALTGHALANTAGDGQPACDGFIVKPCGPDTMLEEVRRVLK